ncbi:hypothetical protein ACS0TY_011672 [Phlomoides rotata]
MLELLLCAGITTYCPLRYFGLDKPCLNVGVVGLSGLGHVAVKFAKAFGCKVTVISTSVSKKKEAIEYLGADVFFISSDLNQITSHCVVVKFVKASFEACLSWYSGEAA